MPAKKSFKYYSTTILAYCFVVFYITVSMTNDALNTIIPALEQMHGWTRGEITSAVSIGAIISIILLYIFGTLAIKIGVRKVVSFTLVALGIATIFMANADFLKDFQLYIAIVQMFAAVMITLPPILLANWFVAKRGRAMGIATIGAPFGGATFNLIVGSVMMAKSFAFAYTGVGIVIIVVGIIGFFLIVDKPEDVGLAPDGADMSADEIAAMKFEMEDPSTKLTLRQILSKRSTWLYLVSFGVLNLMISGMMSQMIPRLLDVGVPFPKALMMMSLAAAMGMGLSYVWGWLDDKISTQLSCALIALTFAGASVFFLFATASNMTLILLAIFFLASMVGGLPNLEVSMIVAMYGRKEFMNVQRYVRLGVMSFRSFGFVAMGVLYDRTGSYDLTYMIFIGFAIASSVIILFIKPAKEEEAHCKAHLAS